MRFLFKLLTPIVILFLLILSLFLLIERKTVDVQALTQIDPTIQTQKLIAQNKYADAHEYLSYFMDYDYVKKDPKAVQLYSEINEKRNSFAYKRDKLLEGLIFGGSDEDIGKASAVASDFLLIGDIRDLAIEGKHYINDEKVDKVLLALSTLGIVATASTIYSWGATTPIKTTISFLKYGKNMNKLPTWLNKKLITEARIAKKSESLKRIESLLSPITKLYEKVGLNQTLNLLKKSKNIKEVNKMLTLSKKFGKESNILLNVTHGKILHYSKPLMNIDKKTVLYASTYGEKGLNALQKLGATKFIKRTKFSSNLAKTAYKGNLNSIVDLLQKSISSKTLFILVFSGLFYFIWKFSTLARRIK